MIQIGSFIAKMFLDKNTSFKPAAVYTFLSGLMVTIMLMFMLAALISAIILTLLFCMYNTLLLSNISFLSAFIITASIAVAIIILLVMLARHQIINLQNVVYQQQPIHFRLSSILSSFFDGLLNQPKQRKKS